MVPLGYTSNRTERAVLKSIVGIEIFRKYQYTGNNTLSSGSISYPKSHTQFVVKIVLEGRMKKLAILAIAGLMSVTASAANWVLIGGGEGADGTIFISFYVDADSISDLSGYKTAFVRYDLNEYDQIAFLEYDSITAFTQFDCKPNPRKSRVLSSVIKDGKRVLTKSNTRSDWSVVYPDSAIEGITKFVCSFKK